MNDFMLGEHNRAITELSADMEDVKRDVAKILELLAERRGERHAVSRVAALASVVTAGLFKLGELVYHAMRHA